jgi:hypothetical protein
VRCANSTARANLSGFHGINIDKGHDFFVARILYVGSDAAVFPGRLPLFPGQIVDQEGDGKRISGLDVGGSTKGPHQAIPTLHR